MGARTGTHISGVARGPAPVREAGNIRRMDVQPLPIDGASVLTPARHADARGEFVEWFSAPALAATGRRFDVAQVNCSVSRRGVVRGVHVTDVPPGQAKYVTCLTGEVLDVVVDLRVGSPTFGERACVRLAAPAARSVMLAEGLGHAVCSLTDGATIMYLCSTPYRPALERRVHPLDPDLAIPWPVDGAPVLAPADAAAPTLAEALARGQLPRWSPCPAP